MPTYVVLVNRTEQGIRNVKQTIERTDSGADLAEKHGLEFEQAYWTVGAYDMVAIFTAPDDEAVSATCWRSALRATCGPPRCEPTTRRR
jgi:uncharacterized protein with GYD domain